MHQHSEEVAMNKPQRSDRQTGKTFRLSIYIYTQIKQDFSLFINYTGLKLRFDIFPGVEIV